MSLTHKLQDLLKRDALASVKSWSLRELAAHPGVSSTSTEQLMECAVQRLARQHQSVAKWIESLQQANSSDLSRVRNATKRLDTLRYVHADTYKLARQLLDNRTLWERFSEPDRHVVNATFLELRARHANTVETVVDVVTDLRHVVIENDDANEDLISALHKRADQFLQRRIGIQLLCDHPVELYKGKKPHGGVSVDAPLSVILTDAVLEAQHIVDVHLQIFPETIYPSNTDFTCTMVQPWIHHVLVEILKNAMASSVARMTADAQTVPSPIHIHLEKIIVGNNHSMIAIDVIDRGAGIGNIASAFELGYSSAGRKWDRLDEQQSYAAVRSPLSSLGVGLPVSRYMTEHFGGSLTLSNNNTDGGVGGCTVRIQLPMDDTILERIPGQ